MDLQVLRQIDLFANLDPILLAHIASIMQEKSYKRGTIIFEEGDESSELFMIVKGRVRISKVVPGMGEEALAILDPGSYFGEMELVEPALRAARATAHEDCQMQTFTYGDFRDLLSSDKELAVAVLWNFVRTLSRRLVETDNKVAATFAMAQFQ
jgi:CRP-like cAMP-binding protein